MAPPATAPRTGGRWLVAVTVTVVVAVLTGVATGLISADPGRGFGAAPATTALVGAALAGLSMLVLLVVAGAVTPAPRAGAARRPDGADAERSDADRAALVDACVYVRDRVTSQALGDRLAAALGTAGVVAVEPTGQPFDPARHEAGGAAPTDQPALAGTVAAVEVPGYVDRDGRLLRAPVVTVYQYRPAASR